ncbi:MAG: DegT/DnrJ/EryC1/StrS family aminotransferase [Nanoarchaeota archaeon]
MKVPYSYLEEQFKNPNTILKDLKRLVKRGDFTLGKEVDRFEEQFANLANARYAIGVSSGTAALYLSLQACEVGYGDEVITTPNTFFATVNAIVGVGARPVFVDVRDDYNINPDLIETAITPRTKAIMPVHLTGRPAAMNEIMNIAEKHDLYVIEDAAQSIDCYIKEKHVGNFGIAGGFSFHPLKNLNVWGDAGMIITNDYMIDKTLRELRNQGLKDRDTWTRYGNNLRIASLQALVGNHLINDTVTLTNQRITNAFFYDQELCDISQITIPTRLKHVREVFHIYVIQAERRDELLKYLQNAGIEARVHYPIPLHLQPAASNLGYKKGDFPVTEQQAEKIISLPVHPYLRAEQKNYVVESIRSFYR